MFINLVKSVTISCPCCNTSVRFCVTTDHGESIDLFNAANALTCPKCQEALSANARTVVQSVINYNKAAVKLNQDVKETNSEIS